jgi:hypothetical protein
MWLYTIQPRAPIPSTACCRLQLFRGSDGCRTRVLPDMPVVGGSIAAYCSLLQLLGRVPLPSCRARRNRQRILDEKKWDWLGLFRRVPVPFRDVPLSSAADLRHWSGRCWGDPEWVERAIPCFLRHQLRFVDDRQPATANRRDRGGDLAVTEGNRARGLLILPILTIYKMR